MELQVVSWQTFIRLVEKAHSFASIRFFQMQNKASSYSENLSELMTNIAYYASEEGKEAESWRIVQLPDEEHTPVEICPAKEYINAEGEKIVDRVENDYVPAEGENRLETLSFSGLTLWGAEKVICSIEANSYFIIPDEKTYELSPQLNPSFVVQLTTPIRNMDVKMVLDRYKEEEGKTVLQINYSI